MKQEINQDCFGYTHAFLIQENLKPHNFVYAVHLFELMKQIKPI